MKNITRDKDGYFTITKGYIHQEDTTIIVYALIFYSKSLN